jgi:RES domain-containing protein
MIVFRICNTRYAGDISGRGAEKAGGRWNQRGHPMLYTCQSRALAAMELAVHISLGTIRNDFTIMTIEVPDTSIHQISVKDLPENWNQFPFPGSTQKIGTAWLNRNQELVLKVPSVVIEDDNNYLINPMHPEFKNVKVIDSKIFEFDTRLRQ